MGWLRTFVGILVLLAIAYGVYVSMTRNPRPSSRLDTAPRWGAPPSDAGNSLTSPFGGGSANPTGPLGSFAPAAAPNSFGAAPAGNGSSTLAPPNISMGMPMGATPPGAPTVPPMTADMSRPSQLPPPMSVSAAPAATPPPTTMSAAPGNPGSPYPAIVSPPLPSQMATPTPLGATAPSSTPFGMAAPANGGAFNNRPAPSVAPPVTVAIAPPGPGQAGNLFAPPPAAPPNGTVREEFAAFMRAVRMNLDAGRLDEAHRALSSMYNNPRLSAEESRQLVQLLDQTAGTLIYSRQHLLEQPYRVQPGDTLERIGQLYNVPPELLAKINGIQSPQQLMPGMELKVLRGPFEAQIDLSRSEMALFVQGRYAGRFPIGIGRDRPPVEGKFTVREKKVNTGYPPPGDPSDPLNQPGKRRLDLDNQLSIHAADRAEGRGSIGLGAHDIDDVFDILSVGSTVVIRR